MTMTPEPPEQQPASKIEELLASPELVKAVENDEFKLFLDHIPIAIAVSRLGHGGQRIIYANPAFEMITGLSSAAVEDSGWSVLAGFRHEDLSHLTLTEAINRGEDFLGTFRQERDGATILAQAYASRIENHDGSENYRIAALVDVVERERAQRDEFEQRIRDKDLLLKELQHRVKNNLQLVTALIRLESRNAQRGATVDFDRLAGRIESLALLYQALSTDAFGEEVDLGPYLSEIASAAVRTHALAGIQLDSKVSYCPVSVNVAMPVGLLINELLTNAFKYAFTGRDGGTIALECRRLADDEIVVVIADDGVGMPADATWPARGKLGALILQTLRENTRQVDFRLDSTPDEGTRVTIAFKHAAAKVN
jgi:PAS domain S-box-containing protein